MGATHLGVVVEVGGEDEGIVERRNGHHTGQEGGGAWGAQVWVFRGHRAFCGLVPGGGLGAGGGSLTRSLYMSAERKYQMKIK